MRNLFLLVLGLVVGILGAVSVTNTLRQRDAYPRGLMDVMQHHYATLRNEVRAGKCSAAEADHSIKILTNLSADIETSIYSGATADAPFREYASRLHSALQNAPVSVSDCATLAPALDKIGAACEACHHQYR